MFFLGIYFISLIVVDYNTSNKLDVTVDHIYLDLDLPCWIGICTWHKSTTMWKALWDLSRWETHDNPTPSKITFGDLKKAFLAFKRVELIPSLDEGTRLPPPQGLSKSECELYLKQPLTPPQRKIIATNCTLNHRLAIENGRWSTILISRGNWLCHFCSHDVVANEAHFVMEFPLYNSIRGKFQSLYEIIKFESQVFLSNEPLSQH